MTKSVRRLAEHFSPAHYNVNLNIAKRVQRVFTGTTTINGELHRTDAKIILHAKDLTITSATIDGVDATTSQHQDDELHISTGADLQAGEHTVTISYEAAITDPMHGLYPCYFELEGKPKELLMTQLESHSAREVIPCVDEPAAKATFQLTLTTEPAITVLSNTPIVEQSETEGVMTTAFETTPKMSTYLLAFVAGELAYKETKSKHGVLVRAYATPNHKDELDFSLHNAARFLDFYDDFFGTPYPLPKCDLVACPDFSAGAMENWGLMTFREAAMLVDEKDTPADQRQHIAGVVAHELAHQWFGDLVTMQWWDHLWLNESFANWMETYVPDHFYPEWQLWEQYGANEQQYAFTRDGLASVQAVQQHVKHPDEIATLFDPAIVYAKGGSLINMLHKYLGDDVFRKGLQIYMARHKYGNTVTEDLWRALGEASGKDIEGFMGDWVSKPGHPVVSFEVEDNHAHITQKRFFADPSHANDDPTIWPVPLLSTSLPDIELLQERYTKAVLQPAPYHMLNEGGTGFYHVRYDKKTLANLAHAVTENALEPGDRQRLLFDGVALNRAGLESTIATLRLLSHYDTEDNYAVWLGINAATGTMRMLINDDPALKPDLQRFIAGISRSQYERLGWTKKEGESHFDTLLRPFVIGNLAYAEDANVTKQCLDIFEKAAQPEDMPSDIRSIIYSAAVRERGEPAVEKLLGWYKTTPSADERINIAAGLSSIRDAKIAKRLLGLITTKMVKLQDVFYWYIYFIRSRYARDEAWQWMIDNWAWIEKQYGGSGDADYGHFPKYSASAFSTPEDLTKYKAFFDAKMDEPALNRLILQGIEDIEIRIQWRERDLEAVADFLKKS
jgi:aminopeptidase N